LRRSGNLTGMCGVYLAAAELSRRGFVVTPTARNAKAADLLVANPACTRAYTVQVKTNAVSFDHFLMGSDNGEARSPSHIYVFINLIAENLHDGKTEFFVVPSLKLGKVGSAPKRSGGRLHGIKRGEVENFRDAWDEAFGRPDLVSAESELEGQL